MRFPLQHFIYLVLENVDQGNKVCHFYGDVAFDYDINYEIFNLTNVGKNVFLFLFLLKFQ